MLHCLKKCAAGNGWDRSERIENSEQHRETGKAQGENTMKIIKRNGAEETFRIEKIIVAITKANNAAEEAERLTPLQIDRIAQAVEIRCEEMNRSLSVEEIQDLVEDQIMAHGAFEVAKRYITYRYTRSLVRQSNTTDDRILSLIECNNEEVKQENANKNPTINACLLYTSPSPRD
mgnify:FL=1